MTTLDDNTRQVGSSCYYGGRGHWLIASAMHRDSDCLTRSNFTCFQTALKELEAVRQWQGEFSPVAIERFSHWAVGWCDYLLVDPDCKPAVELSEQLREKLEDYPILDEEHYSELENDEANQIWRDCYRERERLEYIRKHRGQFDFRDFQDLIGCVRGKYFSGYASELVN